MTATIHPIGRRAPPAAASLNVHGRVEAILAAANSLIRDGYTIIDFQGAALSVRPVLWLLAEPRLSRLVERDLAAYYHQGADEHGRYRIGQFERLGATVKWIERLGAEWRH